MIVNFEIKSGNEMGYAVEKENMLRAGRLQRYISGVGCPSSL